MNQYFYLCEDEMIIRIKAKRRPSKYTIPKSSTWVVNEFCGRKWQMPCYPEITWGRLKELKFIGKITPNPKER